MSNITTLNQSVGFSSYNITKEDIKEGTTFYHNTIEGEKLQTFEEAVKTAEKLVEKYREKFAPLKDYIDPEQLDWDNDQEFYATFIASRHMPNPDGLKHYVTDGHRVKVENGVITYFKQDYKETLFKIEGVKFMDLPNILKGLVIVSIYKQDFDIQILDTQVTNTYKNVVEVKVGKKGRFIGKGGENIKKLQKMLGVRVKVV